MRRAADHLPRLAGRVDLRVVYADLDGTLLGPGGSLFADADGRVSMRAVEAVAALHRAGVALVPISGRTVQLVREAARLLGSRSYIAELGAITSFDGEFAHDFGPFTGTGTPFQAMARSGAAAVLLETFEGTFEPHAPWAHLPREASMLFRGQVDLAEARALLDRSGFDWLSLEDNGIIPRWLPGSEADRFPGLDVDEVHAYHLVPRGVSKAAAAAADLARRGLGPEAAIGVGDSPADAELAPHVAAVLVVANGRRAVEATGAWPDNVYVTDASYGDGFAEVVFTLLRA
ncbi:MAG TPA: HAD family phosphatase [Actinomycetota bacterium]|nr:HAD family phosphatase [Actinomycetota bacterium]